MCHSQEKRGLPIVRVLVVTSVKWKNQVLVSLSDGLGENQELAKAILSAEWNSQAIDDLGSAVYWGLTMLPCYAMLGSSKHFFGVLQT